jgi:hypothetical protein
MKVFRSRVVIGGVAAVAAGGVAAYAAIPDGNKVIHACYQQQSGQLRVIDTDRGDSCRPSERALQWNQQGPKGDRGPQGPPGPPGSAGGGTVLSGTADSAFDATGQTVLVIPGFGTVKITQCHFDPNLADPAVSLTYQRSTSDPQRIGPVGGRAGDAPGASVASGDGGATGAIQIEDVSSRRVATVTGSITSDAHGCHAFAQAVVS